MSLVSIFLASVALLQSAPVDESARFQTCLETIESDPSEGYEYGLAWTYQGNRPVARHCTALALVALNQKAEGAARLEELANAADGGSIQQRAVYLTQAGNAWMQAGAPEAAELALTNALKLSPRNVELLIDRASARLMQENWTQAVTDLDTALNLRPGDGPAHHLRAEAHLNLEHYQQAQADVSAAMRAAPDNIDTLLLRGRVREAERLSKVSEID